MASTANTSALALIQLPPEILSSLPFDVLHRLTIANPRFFPILRSSLLSASAWIKARSLLPAIANGRRCFEIIEDRSLELRFRYVAVQKLLSKGIVFAKPMIAVSLEVGSVYLTVMTLLLLEKTKFGDDDFFYLKSIRDYALTDDYFRRSLLSHLKLAKTPRLEILREMICNKILNDGRILQVLHRHSLKVQDYAIIFQRKHLMTELGLSSHIRLATKTWWRKGEQWLFKNRCFHPVEYDLQLMEYYGLSRYRPENPEWLRVWNASKDVDEFRSYLQRFVYNPVRGKNVFPLSVKWPEGLLRIFKAEFDRYQFSLEPCSPGDIERLQSIFTNYRFLLEFPRLHSSNSVNIKEWLTSTQNCDWYRENDIISHLAHDYSKGIEREPGPKRKILSHTLAFALREFNPVDFIAYVHRRVPDLPKFDEAVAFWGVL